MPPPEGVQDERPGSISRGLRRRGRAVALVRFCRPLPHCCSDWHVQGPGCSARRSPSPGAPWAGSRGPVHAQPRAGHSGRPCGLPAAARSPAGEEGRVPHPNRSRLPPPRPLTTRAPLPLPSSQRDARRAPAPLTTRAPPNPHRPHRETPEELPPPSRHSSLCSTATVQPEDTRRR